MEHPHYQVGIDLGTTYTAAAVCRGGPDARPETVGLATASAAVASVVFLSPEGTLLVGEPAQRRALSEPGRVVREFKRRIGDDTPLVVGGTAVPADAISARFVAWVVEEVARREGGPASSIAVTHPVEWGEHKRSSFAAALAAEGVPEALFLTEPQAAAIGYTNAERIAPGHTVAVYDLGGGTFDAAVVRKAADGSFALLGRPTGIERLGGVDFDDAIFTHVRAAIGDSWDALDGDDPAVQTAVAGLRRECTAAKETLSADTEVMIPVLLPGLHTMVRLGRAEFEDMIRPSVVETVEALRRAIVLAEVDPTELDAVLLVGGSSRIPLVSQLVSSELGRPISVDTDPKAVVAAGAALAARGLRAVEPTDPARPYDAWIDDVPTSPLLGSIGAPALTPTDAPEARRRTHVLLATAVVGVAAAFTLSATAVAGFGPFTPRPVADRSAAAAPAAAPPAVDPWTGAAADQENATGPGGDTADTVTTLAGPRRPAAVAAAVRPLARNVPTGATGAGQAVASAVVREAAATSVVTNRQTTASTATPSTSSGTSTRTTKEPTKSTTGTGSTGKDTGSTGTGTTGTTGGGTTGGSGGAGTTGTTGGGSGSGSGTTGTGTTGGTSTTGGTGTGTGTAGGTGTTGTTGGTGTTAGSTGGTGGDTGSTGGSAGGGSSTGGDTGSTGSGASSGGDTGSTGAGSSSGGAADAAGGATTP